MNYLVQLCNAKIFRLSHVYGSFICANSKMSKAKTLNRKKKIEY